LIRSLGLALDLRSGHVDAATRQRPCGTGRTEVNDAVVDLESDRALQLRATAVFAGVHLVARTEKLHNCARSAERFRSVRVVHAPNLSKVQAALASASKTVLVWRTRVSGRHTHTLCSLHFASKTVLSKAAVRWHRSRKEVSA